MIEMMMLSLTLAAASGPVQTCQWPNICAQSVAVTGPVRTCVWPNVCAEETPIVTTCSLPNTCA